MLRAIICLCISSTTLWATTIYEPTLEELLPTEWEILHLRIEEGKAHNFEYEDRVHACGMSYKASVVERIWGSGDFEELVFESSKALTVSHEYIIFVGIPDRVLPPGHKYVYKPELIPHFYTDSYQTCIENLEEFSGGTAYEFMPGWRDEEGNLEWLKAELGYTKVPESVKTMKVRCESEDNDETACDITSESVFIHWPSLRLYLEERQLNQ